MSEDAQSSPAVSSTPSTPVWLRLAPWVLALGWLGAMFPLAFWGLPTRETDDLLFGGQPPWPAARYQATPVIASRQERKGGADTDLDPVATPDEITDLTTDDWARAAILRRYRLFSRQPDEMITFMALQRMRPGQFDFDPRLYQYGGAYIYSVGAALAAAHGLGFVNLRHAIDEYLESPEKFARFYVVARVVTLLFAALALVAAFILANRAGGPWAGFLAMFLVAGAPVFVSDALEAKPHLPSACLVLWALISAYRYRETGRLAWVIATGVAIGFASGLVLTGFLAFIILPLLASFPPPGRSRLTAWNQLMIGAGIGWIVYFATNPYLLISVMDATAATANLSNSTAMYHGQATRFGNGLKNSFFLLLMASPAAVLVLLIGIAALRRIWSGNFAIAAGVGVAYLVMVVLLGADKPAEFARFLVLPVMLVLIGGAALPTLLIRTRRRRNLTILFAGALAVTQPQLYLAAFEADMRGNNESRRRAGQQLARELRPGDTIAVIQEPAPYAVPPLDFTHRRVFLLPREKPAILDPTALPHWLVFTADGPDVHEGAWWQAYYRRHFETVPETARAPITWANKPAYIFRRSE